MKGQFYKEKRHKLLEKVKDNSVVVLFFESSKVQHSLTSPGIKNGIRFKSEFFERFMNRSAFSFPSGQITEEIFF